MGFFERSRNWLVGTWNRIQKPIGGASPHRVELKITPATGGCLWQEGSDQKQEAMLVYCRLFMTNVGPHASFQILNVKVQKPFTHALICVRNMQTQGIVQEEPVEHMGARLAVTFNFRFVVCPPVVETGGTFVCDVVVKDQFGEEHRAKKVEFMPYGAAAWNMMRERQKVERETMEKKLIEAQQKMKEVQDARAGIKSEEQRKPNLG